MKRQVISVVETPESLPPLLRQGLLLVEVMGKDVRGFSFQETCERISGAGRPLRLRFEPRNLTVASVHVTRNRANRRGSLGEEGDEEGEEEGVEGPTNQEEHGGEEAASPGGVY